MSRVVALLPMKGHSERVPNKNLRHFSGKPLYHWIMQTLLDSRFVDQVCVNTDSEKIAEDVKKYFPDRTRIVDRPARICGDMVSMNSIIEYDLSQLKGDFFLQTHSTNPLLGLSTLNNAIETFLKPGSHDSLFGVNRFQSRFYDQQARPVNHNPSELLRTQDLPPLFEENSNVYLFSRTSFGKQGFRIGKKPILFEIPKLEAVDIDTENDFKLAEFIHQTLRSTVAI